MKSPLKSIALAAVFACATPAVAQQQTPTREEAQVQADREVAKFCDVDPSPCTAQQRAALVDLLRGEIQRPAPKDEIDLHIRQAFLREGIQRIMRPPAAPAPSR